MRSYRARQAIHEKLGRLFKGFVGGVGPTVLPHHVVAALTKRYGIKVEYLKAHRVLKYAQKLVRGSSENGYEELPSYLYMIRRANPGTFIKLEVDEEDKFKFMFIAFGACIHGFPFMRKVVVVDGCIQRNLHRVMPDDKELAIISDRHRAIGKAIAKVYPLSSRGICTFHLHKNIVEKFKGLDTFKLVKKAATAYRLADFNALFRQIQACNPGPYNYLQKADLRMWSRVHFSGDRSEFKKPSNWMFKR
ncbi:uncharacterized protein LOC112089291 [Eutrema salsugineum]|uniref:uncharacterized protein LOC112089291 n=1 Tax=Eutrema salsugineum TaxID=72664 RepID=UPI000CED3032|nr:uncharacterized protein LOC112089291 [Eutrema salsugineum]